MADNSDDICTPVVGNDELENDVSGPFDGEPEFVDELCDESFDDGVALNQFEEVDEEPVDSHGLRSRCPFNSLLTFHAVENFPPDVMHDLFEGRIGISVSISLKFSGVANGDLLGILKILQKKKWFTSLENQYLSTVSNLSI